MKDSGLRIRVERELRDRFLEICHQQDRHAAQVLRQFMREYIARNDVNDQTLSLSGVKRSGEKS